MKKNKSEITKDQLARALADYDNLVKRVEKEKIAWVKFAGSNILEKIIPALDSLENAQKYLKDQGLAIAIGELKKVFNEEGLEEVLGKEGDDFNPNVHEVVENVEGKDKGKIASLVLPGWRFKEGPVLRFARVKVYNYNKEEGEK